MSSNKSNSRKRTTAKKGKTEKQEVLKDENREALHSELYGALITAAAVLVFVCLFVRGSGAVPRFIGDIMFGIFGLGAFAVPIVTAVFGISIIILKRFKFHIGRIISTIVFVLSIIGLLHCVLTDVYARAGLDYWKALAVTYNEAVALTSPFNMGLFATLYIYPLYKLCGGVVIIVLLCCAIAVSVILLFNFSYRKAGQKVKVKLDEMQVSAKLRRQEQEEVKTSKVKMFNDIIEDEPKAKKRRTIPEKQEPPESPLTYEEPVRQPYNGPSVDYTMPESEYVRQPDFADAVPEQEQETGQDTIPDAETDIEAPAKPETAEPVSEEFSSFELPKEQPPYKYPPIELLSQPKQRKDTVPVNYQENAAKLERTLNSYGIRAHVINYTVGPAVTRYELTLEEGIRVNKILALSDDIALSMAAVGVRIEAPIPGKSAIGIEIPNANITMVCLREVVDSDSFKNHPSCVAIGLGKDITGRAIVADIAKMPHLLIAGQTGSGKSVAINSLIISLLYKSTPAEVRMILIDPKKVELSGYNGMPHLLLPVVTDPKNAAGALQYIVRQMEKRYTEFNKRKVKDILRYNELMKQNGEPIMYRIVVIVDELNDLMMVCPGEVEDSVLRIAQLARAAGIYLVLATQRPSVNVITGVIKANIPSRMAFAVASPHDSRTILDRVGAERLVGKGDMLYHHNGESKPLRIQGAYVDESDIDRIITYVKENAMEPEYIDEEEIVLVQQDKNSPGGFNEEEEEYDELIFKAVETIMTNEQASISLLQRKLGIGYARAGRLIDAMEQMHIVGPGQGSKPREILITYEQYLNNYKKK